MGLTLIEKILAKHTRDNVATAGSIVDILIDVRAARDFGGANVVKNLEDNGLTVDDPARTFFTFDCNPTGSDQKYAANQQRCRVFARNNSIKVFDINEGIGTHIVIDEGFALPGGTIISTDSHANILGAIGAFGQGMGDRDIAAAWANGYVWFKVPKSVKINLTGKRPVNVAAKDIVLNLLNKFGANTLLGYSVEIYGEAVDGFSLDDRITISSMATEMGAIIILFTPNKAVVDFCEAASKRKIEVLKADRDATYVQAYTLAIDEFIPMISRPGHPDDAVDIETQKEIKIDSAFIGSCTNGRYTDMEAAANVLKGRKVAPGVVLKIVPATDEVWNKCLANGLIDIFKKAGTLVSNAGCAGCAAGQVGQNGPGEITMSTGNRNFAGKQGKGKVYLSTPSVVAASAVAGYICLPDAIPTHPVEFAPVNSCDAPPVCLKCGQKITKKDVIKGKVWIVKEDNIDTDMIFHNRYLTITDIDEMGQYTFDNLAGWEDFAKKAESGDIIITGKNFGAGSSRQQAVDCFKSLGCQMILAESFGAIYERNAINAAFPVAIYDCLAELELEQRDMVEINLIKGEIINLENGKLAKFDAFSPVQLEIYKRDGLLKEK